MYRSFFCTIFSLIISVSKMYSQDFERLTSDIFLNLKLNLADSTAISVLNSKPGLQQEKATGWTIYPPKDQEGNLIPTHDYTFLKHEHFEWNLIKGRFTILCSKRSGKVFGMMMSLVFKSKSECDSIYKRLKRLYSRYSPIIKRRPNVLLPYEEIKFFANDKSRYVIVTKIGNTANLHIAYNYQEDVW